MPSYSNSTPVSRTQILVTGIGLIAESFPSGAIDATWALVTGKTYFMAVGLCAGDVISNVHLVVNGAGSGTTLAKVGLYDKTGTRLAASADLGTAWHSVGRKTHALATPYTVPADDLYYVAVLHVWTTTAATMPRGAAGGGTETAIGSNPRTYATEASQTDLDATATLADGERTLWVGVS